MPATFLQEKYDMPIEFFDRIPGKLGRVRVTPENGGTPYYAVIERADEPVVAGTPLNAASLNAAQETLAYQDTSGVHTFKRVYIATNGNDANTGATASVPMVSIRAAIRKYAKWHKYLELYLADGTYTENIGTISTDNCSLSIRSTSEDKEKVIINMASILESHITLLRLYNITINMTAANTRALTIHAGMLYAYNIRVNMPVTSTASCINVYSGASAFLSECVINAGTSAAVYGNQALHIRAYACTSERTVARAFYANLGSLIEYSPTMTATEMAYEAAGGKCVLLDARPGSVMGEFSGQSGQYCTSDGLLFQWGMTIITPTAANTPTAKTITYLFPFASTPAVFLTAIDKTPQQCDLSIQYVGIDTKTQASIVVSRTSTAMTQLSWLAIGRKG
jgi:hypothetical protein